VICGSAPDGLDFLCFPARKGHVRVNYLEKEQKSLRNVNNYRYYGYLGFHHGDLID